MPLLRRAVATTVLCLPILLAAGPAAAHDDAPHPDARTPVAGSLSAGETLLYPHEWGDSFGEDGLPTSDPVELPDGVVVDALVGAETIRVANTTDAWLVVLGRFGEPMVRARDGGVQVNRNSPTWQEATTREQLSADEGFELVAKGPSWEERGAELSWFELRAGHPSALPPGVSEFSGQRQTASTWSVEIVYDEVGYAAVGSIFYDPPALPWLVVPVLSVLSTPWGVVPLAIAAGYLTFWLTGSRGRRERQPDALEGDAEDAADEISAAV